MERWQPNVINYKWLEFYNLHSKEMCWPNSRNKSDNLITLLCAYFERLFLYFYHLIFYYLSSSRFNSAKKIRKLGKFSLVKNCFCHMVSLSFVGGFQKGKGKKKKVEKGFIWIWYEPIWMINTNVLIFLVLFFELEIIGGTIIFIHWIYINISIK